MNPARSNNGVVKRQLTHITQSLTQTVGLECPSPSFSSAKLEKYFLTFLVSREDTITGGYSASVAEG